MADNLSEPTNCDRAFQALLDSSIESQKLGCCKRKGTLWDVIAVYPPGIQWTNALPAPKFFAGPVVRGAPEWEAQLGQHS
jgi:hypothetical protein